MAAAGEPRKPVRLWLDGCYDMMHYGHANAIRQARALGDVIVIGVHSDAEILANKGPTLMNEQERYAAVRACKWVDEVVEDAPYLTSVDVCKAHNIDFVIHGDDTTLMADGTDCYQKVKDAGMYKEVKRTTGVSTTDMVGRMLECIQLMDGRAPGAEAPHQESPLTKATDFVATSTKIAQFSNGKVPTAADTVVYIDGAWDCFHAGHIDILRKARELGTFLIVGVFDDHAVNSYKEYNLPLSTLHERVLSVLSCRYVDEVVIAPAVVLTKGFVEELNIKVVAHGSVADQPSRATPVDPYQIPKEMGIFRVIQSGNNLTTTAILDRVRERRGEYEARNRKKVEKELKRLELEKEMKAKAAAGAQQ